MEEKGEGVSREELVGPRIGRRGQDRAQRAGPEERKQAEPRVGAGESRRGGAGGAGGWSGRPEEEERAEPPHRRRRRRRRGVCAGHMVEEPSPSASLPAAEHCHRKPLRRACAVRPAGAACTRGS